MTVVYDKDGKEYNVPHAIDLDGWLKAGYTLEKPEHKKRTSKQNTEVE